MSSETEAIPTAEPILEFPGLIGAKTGYTDLAGGNLVVAFDLEIGHPVIAVVLGSTQEGRFTDMRALIEAARIAY
jgi:D-alanyl-D-alanine carboxypeptidase